MADDQVIGTLGRRAVLERDDVAIGSANANVQDAHLGLGVRCDFRFGMIDHADVMLGGEDGDGEHS